MIITTHTTQAELERLADLLNVDDVGWVEETLHRLCHKLSSGRYSLAGGYTSWRPLGGGTWRGGDGSELECSLAVLIADYFELGQLEKTDYAPQELLIPHVAGQAEYEAGQTQGDWQ